MKISLWVAIGAVIASFTEGRSLRLNWYNDFEDGSLGPWSDVSTSDVVWRFESVGENIMANYTMSVPPPPIGQKYLRAYRPKDGVTGSATLQSEFFWANPGDAISMYFWIHSPVPRQNSLTIYWLTSTGEQQIFSGNNYSDPNNLIWRVECHKLPIAEPTYTQITIYAFIEDGFEDSITIDNVDVSPVEDENYCNGVFLPTDPPTTAATTTTTPIPTDPPVPDQEIDFSNSTHGWALSAMNGARWIRVGDKSPFSPVPGVPIVSGIRSYIAFNKTSYYTGSTFAFSPLYQIAPNRDGKLNITFWMSGSTQTPCSLSIGMKLDGLQYQATKFLRLDSYGTVANSNWVTVSASIPYTPDPFQLVLEGYAGQNKSNQIAVSKIVISGVEKIESPIWDIDNGTLNGWTGGRSQGSYWSVATEPNGDPYLTVVGQIARPGMSTVESPLLPPFSVAQQLQLRFRIKGNLDGPPELTVRRRTADGLYDEAPLMDLRSYGTVSDSGWLRVVADLPATDSPYQIVLEGYLSFGLGNLIGVDDVVLISPRKGEPQIETSLFPQSL